MVKWFFLLAFSLILFVSVIWFILPRIFLKPNYAIKRVRDRGVKKIDERNGCSTIIYEPDVRFNSIIKQYILSDRGPTKVLVCKLCYGIRYIDFDVVVFNSEDKIITSLNVKELVGENGVTDECDLPDETAYVTILVNKANEKEIANKIASPIPSKKAGFFALLSSLVVIVEILLLKWCLSNIIGGVFRESVLMDGMSILWTCGVCLVCALINMVVCYLLVKHKNKIVRKEGK